MCVATAVSIGLEEVDGQSAIYVALEVCSWGTRGADCVLERHLVHGPSAFLYTPEQIPVPDLQTLWTSSKVMGSCLANASRAFCRQYAKHQIQASFRNFNCLKLQLNFSQVCVNPQ